MTSRSHHRRIAATTLAAAAAVCFPLLALRPSQAPSRAARAASAPADEGYIPDGKPLSPFDDAPAAIAKLDPALRRALRHAATDARADRITILVSSGWRSAHHQQELLDAAIARYGSERVAREYVNTPEKSTHVSGKAVDVAPTDADYWLIQHGAAYGLCQIYANEVWHFELAVAPGGTCPAPDPDASSG